MTARRITTRGIIFKDGKLLCQLLKPGADGAAREYWCTPGGGLDPDETLHDGLSREMIEETGIAPKIGRLLFVQQYKGESHGELVEQLEFFFHVENPEDYHTIDLAATTHGELEIEHVEFVDPRRHEVLPAFLQSVDIQAYIDGKEPPLVYAAF
jgi:ADP-ribose pyrophosphatase YjhB (NUDIX family)